MSNESDCHAPYIERSDGSSQDQTRDMFADPDPEAVNRELDTQHQIESSMQCGSVRSDTTADVRGHVPELSGSHVQTRSGRTVIAPSRLIADPDSEQLQNNATAMQRTGATTVAGRLNANSEQLQTSATAEHQGLEGSAASAVSQQQQSTRTRAGRPVRPPERLGDCTYAGMDEAAFIESLMQQGREHDITLAAMTDYAVKQMKHDHISWNKAMRGPEGELWRAAVDKEISAFTTNGVISQVPLSPGDVPLRSMILLSRKFNADGEQTKLKARLVADGSGEQVDLHYDPHSIYAPASRAASLRILLSMVNAKGLHMQGVDFVNAFLQGNMDGQRILMRPPAGYEQYDENGNLLYWLLHKAVYGLKQSAKLWNDELSKFLISDGFKQCVSDPSVFTKFSDNDYMILFTHVDDTGIISTEQKQIDAFTLRLKGRFAVTQNDMTEFIGLKITRDLQARSLELDQTTFALNLLEKLNMTHLKGASVPARPDVSLSAADCPTTAEGRNAMAGKPYRLAVGSLNYLALMTRPDIMEATRAVSRYASNPGPKHWEAVKQICRYLIQYPSLTLKCTAEDSMPLDTLLAYSDASWASDVDDRTSVTGYLVTCNNMAVSWASTTQKSVAMSSMHAEYMGAAATALDVSGLRTFMEEIGAKQTGPTIMYEDNQSCIALSHAPVMHKRSKHIEIRHHYLRQQVRLQQIKLKYVRTHQNLADIFTKPLAKGLFSRLRDVIMGRWW